MNIEDVFGLPVGVSTLTTLDCEKVISYLDNQSMVGMDGPEGEYTLNQQLLEEDIFKETKQEVQELTLEYAREVLCHDVKNIAITTSWANLTHSDDFIRPHKHSNSYLSGCFYLNHGSNINFYNPIDKQDLYMLCPVVNFEPHNKYTWGTAAVTPQANMLIMFPSGLAHGVDPSPTRRHSIAYNTMPLGPVGGETNTLNIRGISK